MSTQTILVDGEAKEIEVKPITLLCHPGGLSIDAPGTATITPEDTLAYVRDLQPREFVTVARDPLIIWLFGLVWGEDVPMPYTLERLHLSNVGVRHTVGLLCLTVKAMLARQTPFWKLPETFLHPRQQVGLGDVLIYLQRVGEGRAGK